MKIFKRKPVWDKPFSEKIAKRVSKISTNDLSVWADQSLYEIGRLLTNYERNRTDANMNELLMGAEALHAVIAELNKRTTTTR
jgi:hypothetical protein